MQHKIEPGRLGLVDLLRVEPSLVLDRIISVLISDKSGVNGKKGHLQVAKIVHLLLVIGLTKWIYAIICDAKLGMEIVTWHNINFQALVVIV